MSDVPYASNSGTASGGDACGFELPLAAMVRAVCRAAETGSDALFDVMLKVALMVDAAAPTYGMATFSQKHGERPHLKWVEGLDPEETSDAEEVVAAALALSEASFGVRADDQNICLVLSAATAQREGAAIYGRFVRPLTERQASGLRILSTLRGSRTATRSCAKSCTDL